MSNFRIKCNVDTLPVRYLLAAGVLASIYLFVLLIVGLAGPNSHTKWKTSSFKCDGVVEYSWEDNCTGVDMSVEGAKQQIFLPPLTDPSYEMSSVNFQLSLQVWPFNHKYQTTTQSFRKKLKTQYSLYGTDKADHTKTPDESPGDWTLIDNANETQTLLCPRKRPECYGFLLFLQRGVNYKYYFIEVEFLDSDGKEYVQNSDWISSTNAKDFNEMQLGFRMFYMSVAILLTILWVIPLRSLPLADWPFEQRAIFVLLVGLIFFNDPFYAAQLNTSSWFVVFIDSLFQITFTCLLFMYWFFVLDNVRIFELREPVDWSMYIKFGCVLLYGVLSIILASWLDMRFATDPSLGKGSLTGIVVMYYITSCVFGGLVILLIVLAVLTIPSAYHKPHLEVRFMYLSLPAALVCMSMLIGVFAGTFGPYNRSSVSFLYFFGLYNCYVYMLVFGFFPSIEDMTSDFRAAAQSSDSVGGGGEEHIQILHQLDREGSQDLSDESAARSLGML